MSESITGGIDSVVNDSASVPLNETVKFQATAQGLFIAYASLLVMALVPIVIGSFRSVKHRTKQQETGEQIEIMSTKDALMFPVIASGTLFGIYLVFQVFGLRF
jgi:minor histocompatibility antigen H13